MMSRRRVAARAGARRRGHGIRDRDGRACPAADERRGRRRCARARRRDDRGVRRRRVRPAERARLRAEGDRDRGGGALANRSRSATIGETRRRCHRSTTERSTAQNPCLSGGAIEIFLEPVLPAPRVLVVGDTPIAAAVLPLGAELGLERRRRRRRAPSRGRRPRARRRRARARRAAHAAPRARGGRAVRRPRGEPQARRRRARRAARRRRARRAARADRRARRHRHRRAHARRDRAVDPGADRRRPPWRARRGLPADARARAPAVTSGDRRRPDLRHDRRRGPEHALARARRRDRLLLLRRLQGQVRGAARHAAARDADAGSPRSSRPRQRPGAASPVVCCRSALRIPWCCSDTPSAQRDGATIRFCREGCGRSSSSSRRHEPGRRDRRGPRRARALVPDIETLARRLADVDYLVDEGLATSMFLSLRLPQPLLLEGEAGVGKTEAAKSLAAVLDTPLIRLQCYEGIDAAEALYEWNYPRQLLEHPPRRLERRGARRGGAVRPRLPDPPPAPARARASRPAARGAADRRDRPRRRRLRGLPARAARRGERDDPRDRHDPRPRTRRSSC